jgi:L-threonylcarbamoyladenylate synthase
MSSGRIIGAADPSALDRAAAVIERGGIVAVPTETYYGLAADATSAVATSRIFEVKGRPASLALPLVAGSVEQITQALGPLDPATAKAARAFWPGPLSLVMAATPAFGGTTVAIRVPAHDFVRALAERTGRLLTATSANKTGEPPAQTVDAVIASLGDLVDLVVDGGRTAGGKPSTIADLRGADGAPPRLIRDGAIAWERVLESLA